VSAAFGGVPPEAARSHRRMLGALFLWCLVPLPFVYILMPAFWFTAALVGLWRLVQAEKVWKPGAWIQNGIGLVVLAAAIAAGGLAVGPLRPLGHLLVLLTAARVAMVDDLRDVRRALPAVFLVWVVSVVSSFHVTLLLYFVASIGVWWFVGMRVLLDGLSEDVGDDLGRPRLRHVVAATLVSLILAVPLFVLLPRLGSPVLAGPSFGRSSGFSTSVHLSRRGSIQESSEQALSLRSTDGRELESLWARVRATGFHMVMPGSWTYIKTGLEAVERDGNGRIWLDPEVRSLDGARAIEIRQWVRQRFLFLPEGTVAVEFPGPLFRDPAGGLRVPRGRPLPTSFLVWARDEPLPGGRPPEARDTYLPRRNPAIADYARSVVGGRRGLAAAARIESHLRTEFEYSLEDGGRPGRDPVAWFLFERRSGHCEYFAGAMVEMLRHVDVPARLVSGYSGGYLSADGDELIVREANAHTWVEVWGGDDRGWQTFDPTPAVGVGAIQPMEAFAKLLTWLANVEVFFDRSILGYSLADQVSAVESLVAGLAELGRPGGRPLLGFTAAVVMGVVMLIALFRVRRRRGATRRRGPASRAMTRVERRLRRGGLAIPRGATVGWLADQAARTWDGAGPPVRALAGLADAELYGERTPPGASAEVSRLWRDIMTARRGS
jgi:hypothetical protein